MRSGWDFHRRAIPGGQSLPFSPRLKPLFIPWDRVKRIREGSLYWRKTAILSIGEPEIGTITLFMDLFDQARPFITGNT